MSLPPELIHRILGHLSNDSQSLRAMALVSKDWVAWCQAHLFKSVHLKPPILKAWLKNVAPELDGPASHTRVLILEEYRLIPWINPRYLDFPLSRLESFSDVRSLSLIHWNATLFDGAPLGPHLGHFGRSLRTLSLQFCTFNPVTFLDFLSLLPSVEDLEIACPYLHSDTLDTIPNAPDVVPSFRGTLSLGDFYSGRLILRSLAALPLHFSAIRIRGCTFYEPEEYQILLTSCRDSLINLRFEESYRDSPLPGVSLALCDKLQEIHVLLLNFTKLPRSLDTFLASITSKNLRRISLTFMDFVEDDGSDQEYESDFDDDEEDESNERSGGTVQWDALDTTLGRLAQNVHGAESKLTLQLNVRRATRKPFKLGHLLPKFSACGGLVDINYK